MRTSVFFTLNGKLIELKNEDVFLPLSDILRYQQRKTGTKVVCAEGDCGACTVMIANTINNNDLKFKAINSCILTGFLADGMHIVTVEGLNKDNSINEVQDSMVRNFGGQCGFCTPGFVMAITNMYEQKSKPSCQNIKNYLTGNLCRCTGYKPIIEAAQDVDENKHSKVSELYNWEELTKKIKEKTSSPLLIESQAQSVYAPLTIQEAVDYLASTQNVRIFSGATDLGVQINKGRKLESKKLSLHLIKELYEIKKENNKISFGAKVTLHQFQELIEKEVPKLNDFFHIFASPQIKNTATVVGNLANGSPIADSTPTLMSLDAELTLMGSQGKRVVPLKNFYKDYKKFDLLQDEIIYSVSFEIPNSNTKLGFYKVSQRRDLDISCVNAAFAFEMSQDIITNAKITYGGVGPTTKRLQTVEKSFQGLKIQDLAKEANIKLIEDNIAPISDVRGTKDFRIVVGKKLFEKFIQENWP